MSGGYPIVLDVAARLVVIVGGGSVGLRKARGLLASGATRVRVVSPAFHPEMPGGLQRVTEMYRAEHLQGASLVFAATDSPDVNDAVVRDAHAVGALVCRADADEENAGDFATPAMLRQGPLLVTVSSGGSPALSALIRDRLEQAIDPRWASLAEAMQVLRPRIRQALAPPRRRDALRALCSDEAMEQVSRGGVEGLTSWLKMRFTEL
jgi:precorrin-2 dehydrogenase / sirohydrochlorin ferrochelatase